MESDYRQLAELLAELEGPFCTEYERQIHERERHLKQASWYHGPKIEREEHERQIARGHKSSFVRSQSTDCTLTVDQAEKHALEEESRAEECGRRITEMIDKYKLAERLLEQTEPELLGELPSLSTMLSMDRIEIADKLRAVRGKIVARSRQVFPAQDTEAHLHRLQLAGGDRQIIQVADNPDLSSNQKMADIIRIDRRFEGIDSEKWATLLNVTSGAIRQTETWTTLQNEKSGDS
jgi:hypothetical protein